MFVRRKRVDRLELVLAQERGLREGLESRLLDAVASASRAEETVADLKLQRSQNRIEDLVLKQVIVHTTHQHSIEGVLAGVYADSVVVRHARYLLAENGVEQLDGEQIIPSRNVEWIQELTDAGTSYVER